MYVSVCRRRPHSIIFEFDHRRHRRERRAPPNYTVLLFERTIIIVVGPVAFTVYTHTHTYRRAHSYKKHV